MLRGANPLPGAGAGLPAGHGRLRLRHDHAGPRCWSRAWSSAGSPATAPAMLAGPRRRGVLLGLVALTVYLPGVLTASVTARGRRASAASAGSSRTDPLALLASRAADRRGPGHGASTCCPTPTWPGSSRPACGSTGVAARREWRPLGGLLLVTVDHAARGRRSRPQLGPLRWPLRLQPFLVERLVVLLVVAWHRFGVRRPSRAAAGPLARLGRRSPVVLALLRAPSSGPATWRPSLLVGGGDRRCCGGWCARDRRAWLAPVVGAVTLAAFALQHVVYPTPPSPQRNAPTRLADYRTPLTGARRATCSRSVPRTRWCSRTRPRRGTCLIGSGWYLDPHPSRRTPTPRSATAPTRTGTASTTRATPAPRCSTRLFTTEPTTGRTRVDLLGVSSLLLVRQDFSGRAAGRTRPRAGRSPRARRTPCSGPGATPVPAPGGVAWTSPGVSVSAVDVAPRVRRSGSTRCRPAAARWC